MSIDLAAETERAIAARMARGGFSSVDELLTAALEALGSTDDGEEDRERDAVDPELAELNAKIGANAEGLVERARINTRRLVGRDSL